jgi:hypothetical protein
MKVSGSLLARLCLYLLLILAAGSANITYPPRVGYPRDFIIGLFAGIYYRLMEPAFWSKPPNNKIVFTIVFIVPFSIISGIFFHAIFSLNEYYEYFLTWVNSPQTTKQQAIIISVSVASAFGGLLYYMRFKIRAIYGFSEALVGLYIAGSRVAENKAITISDPQFLIAYLTAAIYLVVRGLDNIYLGCTKDPLDPVAVKLISSIKMVPGIAKNLFS